MNRETTLLEVVSFLKTKYAIGEPTPLFYLHGYTNLRAFVIVIYVRLRALLAWPSIDFGRESNLGTFISNEFVVDSGVA